MPPSFVLAVHGGAGRSLGMAGKTYKALLAEVLSHLGQSLDWDAHAADVVTAAVTALEGSKLTNAGLGSSLTFDGRVECDAMVCTVQSVGAVGAVEGILHPCQLANEVRKASCVVGPLGLVPPVLLTGSGAQQFAVEQCNLLVNPECHFTESSRKRWNEYRGRLDGISHTVGHDWDMIADTVGAVCVDVQGRVASAVSSGGNWLKVSGRVGAAAVPGAASSVLESIAVAASGNGERMIRSSFALRVAMCLISESDDDDLDAVRKLAVDSEAGMIALRLLENGRVEVLYIHATPSFSIGYFCPASMPAPSARVSLCTGRVNFGGCVMSSSSQ
jgi:taspase, threonine aspartase, 1